MLLLRRDPVRALVLLCLPVALFAYLALQSRYFGRWLLPAYPALALLAAAGVAGLVDLAPAAASRAAGGQAALWPRC